MSTYIYAQMIKLQLRMYPFDSIDFVVMVWLCFTDTQVLLVPINYFLNGAVKGDAMSSVSIHSSRYRGPVYMYIILKNISLFPVTQRHTF